MSRGNDVFQVLTTKGDQAVLPAGGLLETLSPGQLGFFDAKTNLSIADLTTVKNFYAAVGIDRTGNGNIDDVAKSSGTMIQKRNVVALAARCYTPAQQKVVELTDFTADCNEDYGVKFEIRNQQAYRVHGYNQVVKSFVVKTDNCDGCEGCPSGNCITLAQKIAGEVNADDDKLILGEVIATSAITIATQGTAADYAIGDVITDADLDALSTFNSTADEADVVCVGLRFTVQPSTFESYCNINLNYFNPRQTDILVTKIAGFEGQGTLTTTQDLVYEEGSGVDVKQLEYEAGGWNGKPGPYRTSELLGMPRNGFEYLADANEKYVTINLSYDQASIAGFLEHKNNLRTIFAIPAEDTTTRDAVGTVLDTAFDSFIDLTDFLTACPGDGVTVNTSLDNGEDFAEGISTP